MKNAKPNTIKPDQKLKPKPEVRKAFQLSPKDSNSRPAKKQKKALAKKNTDNESKNSLESTPLPGFTGSETTQNLSEAELMSQGDSPQSEEQAYISFYDNKDEATFLGKNIHQPQPWFRPEDYASTLKPPERLHQEVEALVKYLSPTEKEIELREFLFQQVKKAARYLWPKSNAHIFGSFSTQLFLPSSDIDVVVIVPNFDERRLIDGLEKLLKEISRYFKFRTYEVRRNARVPLINFVEKHSGLEVDVSINAVNGIDGGTIITKFIRQCPAIKPINMVLKHFLELNDLNKVFKGGLSSYSLTLLIISFLQIHPVVRAGKINPINNLGLLLVEFFELYGLCFNNNKVGITLTNGGRYYRRSIQSQTRRPAHISTIEILDPQNETNNVSSGSHKYGDVLNAFRGAFVSLSNVVDRYCHREKDSCFNTPLLGTIIHIPQSIIQQRELVDSALKALIKKK